MREQESAPIESSASADFVVVGQVHDIPGPAPPTGTTCPVPRSARAGRCRRDANVLAFALSPTRLHQALAAIQPADEEQHAQQHSGGKAANPEQAKTTLRKVRLLLCRGEDGGNGGHAIAKEGSEARGRHAHGDRHHCSRARFDVLLRLLPTLAHSINPRACSEHRQAIVRR